MGKTATIIASSGRAVELKESTGLYTCLLEHKVSETAATFEWNGPKISEAAWKEMMTFFQWTYDMEGSESQVRLFVHPQHGWKIWAFPQDSASSMTTKEVANEEARTQRAAIPEGYIPFGTVHHHCAANAFQSGTDTHDEHTVDGLHITIGCMDKMQHDMHARLYIKGNKFEVNMAAFWDIGETARTRLKIFEEYNLVVEPFHDKEARKQMCAATDNDHPFEEVWKTNYIPHKPGITKKYKEGKVWCVHCSGYPDDLHMAADCPNRPKSLALSSGSSHSSRRAWSAESVYEELRIQGAIMNIEEEELDAIIEEVTDGQTSEFYRKLLDLSADNFMSFKEIFAQHEKYKKLRDDAEALMEATELAKAGSGAAEDQTLADRIDKMTPADREAFEQSAEYQAWCGHGT